MKTLYFECNMGAAGDMLMAALLELHDNRDDFLKRLNGAGIPGVIVKAIPSVKCGITGTRIKVEINGREEECGNHHERHDRHHHEHDDNHHHNHHSHDHDEHCHEHHSHDYDHHHSHSHDHSHDKHDDRHNDGDNQKTHGLHEHHRHTSYHDVERLIADLKISDTVKKDSLEVYRLIAEAESHAHGVPVDKIHFHEVGEMDAVADIVGVCMLMEELAPDIILSSPVNVGSGHVRCSHGILPVPAPATAFILQSVPMYNEQTEGELCTPTGAALLKYFVKNFCKMPVITVVKHGYGMGKKNFEKANCVRAFIGNVDSAGEEVIELVCGLDDMTPEAVAFAQSILLDEGALDVYTSPIGMKKGRQGLSFTCMCRTAQKDKMLSLIFKHTATLGIREYASRRYTLQKEKSEIQTKFGTVNVKTSRGFGVVKSKPEYEDIAKIARETGKSIHEILREIEN